MGFDSIRENKRESATFMAGHIEKVIKTFGKRSAGSEGEKKAAEYMGELLKPYADDIRLEPFPVYPAAFMGWIYISVSLYLIALAAYFFQPVASLVLFVVATALMVGEFVMYKQVVDKLFVKKTSHNLYAVKHPTGEVHRRIIFSGHVDAAHEWTFNYHLGGKGYIAHVITSSSSRLFFALRTNIRRRRFSRQTSQIFWDTFVLRSFRFGLQCTLCGTRKSSSTAQTTTLPVVL